MEPAYGLASAVLTPPMRFGLRWTIEGAHLIPVRGPVILASNHVSYLDPIVLAYVAQSRGRKVRFLAKAELFQHKVLGPLLRQWRQIPVQRASVDAASSLTAAEDAIGQGECVVIFPEGTISLDLDPMPGKSGAARLAAATGVKITPVGLWGAQRILFKGRKPAWQTGVAESVVVGTPFRVRADENVGAATTRLMEEVACAVARARAIYPQRPATDDDPWWTRTPASAFRHVGAGSGA